MDDFPQQIIQQEMDFPMQQIADDGPIMLQQVSDGPMQQVMGGRAPDVDDSAERRDAAVAAQTQWIAEQPNPEDYAGVLTLSLEFVLKKRTKGNPAEESVFALSDGVLSRVMVRKNCGRVQGRSVDANAVTSAKQEELLEIFADLELGSPMKLQRPPGKMKTGVHRVLAGFGDSKAIVTLAQGEQVVHEGLEIEGPFVGYGDVYERIVPFLQDLL